MASTTVVNKKRAMVSKESLTYMRPLAVAFSATDCKPNCRMYATFDGVDVNPYIKPSYGPDAGVLGGRIFANTEGKIAGILNIPGRKFNTGKKVLRLTELSNFLAEDDIPGSTYGYALAEFSSTGIKETYQETVTSTVTTDRVVVDTVFVDKVIQVPVYVRQPEPVIRRPIFREQGGQGKSDPLAQSFFTFGYDGGCFITSIDIYFYSKDDSYPVIVELREMVNGYPGANKVSEFSRVSKDPADVNLSEDASVATKFTFDRPIYLQEDKEYCFVVMANCQTYNIFTCTMGEFSFETGKKVFEQPMLGSLFKSQNNMTWTAEQYEDIKFKMYRAKFDTAVNAVVKYGALTPSFEIETNFISTFNGSNTLRIKLPFDHNLEIGNKVAIAVDSRGTYNGIPAAQLTGEYNVSTILDEQAFEFSVIGTATSNGVVNHGGFVSHVYVDNTGSGYDSLSAPFVLFSAPPSGTTATGVPVIENGKLTSVKIVNPGTGYTNVPSVSFVGGLGSGATATATLDIKAAITTNRAFNIVTPAIPNHTPAGTEINATLAFTKGNYTGGNVTSYTLGAPTKFNIKDRNWLTDNAWLCSYHNEQAMLGGNKSTSIQLNMSSTNDRLSPMLPKDEIYALFTGYHINNQANETISATVGSASVDRIDVYDGGSGYASTPSITLTNQYGCVGTGATAAAIMSSGTIASINIVNAGTGYTKPPIVSISGASTTAASVQAVLTPFNTEIGATGGSARARYITKTNTLETPAESARVFVNAYSGHNSGFDVYLRSTLKASGVVHTDQDWVLMNCDVSRNKSTKDEEYLEYEFYLDGTEKFDTYDIKIVIKSNNPIDVPWIKDYRAIMTA